MYNEKNVHSYLFIDTSTYEDSKLRYKAILDFVPFFFLLVKEIVKMYLKKKKKKVDHELKRLKTTGVLYHVYVGMFTCTQSEITQQLCNMLN